MLNSQGWEEVRQPTDNFSLLWAWGDPFDLENWAAVLRNLKPHQVGFMTVHLCNTSTNNMALKKKHVSIIPGLAGMTYKETLSTSGFPFIPKSFSLPKGLKAMRQYLRIKPNATFLLKNKLHRGVR